VGHFKTYQENLDGDRQITGFQMPGELLGMDAISTETHQCDAVALQDSEVCEIRLHAWNSYSARSRTCCVTSTG
jgi:CRP/FNR family transcriptional regulator